MFLSHFEPNLSQVVVPRHRSLYDYTLGMPFHFSQINNLVMLLAGDNLFISRYDQLLREYGAMMFLRDDKVLKRPGYPKVFLSQKRYLNDVFPAYLRWQMLDGVGEDHLKHDLIIYPGQEKNPITHIRSGGRTKSGKLRKLNPIFFDKFRKITAGHTTEFYITPMNISFSKYPDTPFIVNPTRHKGLLKALWYLNEQNYAMKTYPNYTSKNPDAKLDVILNYGKPIRFSGDDIKTLHDVIHITSVVREEIGKLECLFPATFVYSLLEENSQLSLETITERAKKHYEFYESHGINIEMISEKPGVMLPMEEILIKAVVTMNANARYPIPALKNRPFLGYYHKTIASFNSAVQHWYRNNTLYFHVNDID